MIKYEVFVALSLTIFQPQNLQELSSRHRHYFDTFLYLSFRLVVTEWERSKTFFESRSLHIYVQIISSLTPEVLLLQRGSVAFSKNV